MSTIDIIGRDPDHESAGGPILVTGSAGGLGRAAAAALQAAGHPVVVHARSAERLGAASDLIAAGARSVVGDLADPSAVQAIADQARELGPFRAVIHNAGIMDGPDLLQVNVLAPYVLTAEVPAQRLVYLSSSMHRGGRADAALLRAGAMGRASYSDSKLLVTAMMAGLARRRPSLVAHAVDPGWVPTRMGGPHASDDLALGHVTQVHLVTAPEAEARPSGGYWHHGRREDPHPAVRERSFQDSVLEELAERTGVELPGE